VTLAFAVRGCVACRIGMLLASGPAFSQSTSVPDEARASGVAPSISTDVVQRTSGTLTVRATRIREPIAMDGRLDDSVYTEVQPVTDFIQQEPVEGAPATEKTEAWVLFDDENLYVACRCWDTHPERIVANDMRRDSSNLRQQDNFGVGLDTFHDKRNGYLFSVSPVGGFNDIAISDERTLNMDWNTVVDAKVGRFEGGWIAEFAIPFKSLRYSPGREQVWGINFRRTVRSKNEHSYLAPVEAAWGGTAIARFSAAATLVGLEAPPAAMNLEVKPYAIAELATDFLASPARVNDVDPDAGFDVKYGVTKSITADFTYNTDFAQVEDDEAQVNLTRFNLSYPEKREFFLEGRGTFSFGGTGGADDPAIFYSRRIGLSGGRPIPIIAGGRLTGKAGKWNIGALSITSDDEEAVQAQQTNFTVMSLRRDVLRRSVVGIMMTRRSVSTLAEGSNEVAGVEGQFQFYQNLAINTYVAKSWTPGLNGNDLSYRGQVNYNADRYGLQIDRLVVEDNFNPEIGFLRRDDFRRNFAAARFSPRPANSRVIRKYSYESSLEYTTDNQDRLETRELQGTFRIEQQNSDLWALTYIDSYELIPEPFTISEGVRIPIGGYNFGTLVGSYTLGQQHRVSGTATFEVGSFYDGDKTTASYKGRLQIVGRLAVEPSISLNWIDIPQGSFTSTIVGGRTTFTVTPRMYAAALVQYSSSTTTLATNIRFRWEYQPGSELFVVYSEGRDTFPPRGVDLETRGLVVKINRLFRF
jgi:hypothetical protein